MASLNVNSTLGLLESLAASLECSDLGPCAQGRFPQPHAPTFSPRATWAFGEPLGEKTFPPRLASSAHPMIRELEGGKGGGEGLGLPLASETCHPSTMSPGMYYTCKAAVEERPPQRSFFLSEHLDQGQTQDRSTPLGSSRSAHSLRKLKGMLVEFRTKVLKGEVRSSDLDYLVAEVSHYLARSGPQVGTNDRNYFPLFNPDNKLFNGSPAGRGSLTGARSSDYYQEPFHAGPAAQHESPPCPPVPSLRSAPSDLPTWTYSSPSTDHPTPVSFQTQPQRGGLDSVLGRTYLPYGQQTSALHPAHQGRRGPTPQLVASPPPNSNVSGIPSFPDRSAEGGLGSTPRHPGLSHPQSINVLHSSLRGEGMSLRAKRTLCLSQLPREIETDDDLHKVLYAYNIRGISQCHLATEPDPRMPGHHRSKCYGFIRFMDCARAEHYFKYIDAGFLRLFTLAGKPRYIEVSWAKDAYKAGEISSDGTWLLVESPLPDPPVEDPVVKAALLNPTSRSGQNRFKFIYKGGKEQEEEDIVKDSSVKQERASGN